MIDKTHLFEGRTNGYHIYRVPGILCTQNNILLATAEARRDKTTRDTSPSPALTSNGWNSKKKGKNGHLRTPRNDTPGRR